MKTIIAKLKKFIIWQRPYTADGEIVNINEIIPLSPKDNLFDNDSSSDFLDYHCFLKSAFQNPNVRNIAITGNHGVGKSSIIHSYESKDKQCGKGYLYISLMDFSDNRGVEGININQDEIVATEDTKQLQQEFERYLLCQILSRINAQNLPHSTFRLIPSNRIKTRVILSALIAAIVLCIYGISFNTYLGIMGEKIKLLYYICGFISTILMFFIAFIISESLSTTKFTAGYAGMKVETEIHKTNGSYIDDHIFEIIYALETLGSDIGYTVVLEDMDRLGRSICINIFTKLRRINYLINDRKNLQGKYMRFIYAFNDSVFELTKNTKFFDYVMSVTPKLNYNTGGEYFKTLLLQSPLHENGKQKTIRNIIQNYDDVFWEYVGMVVHDYRMLNHIRNDFELFVNVMVNRKFVPNEKWLPFVIYKNVLAEDYCHAFEEKGILELNKDDRDNRIEELCLKMGDNYSELVKLLFNYLIDEIHLNSSDFQQFTGLPQKVIDIRNESNDYSKFKEFLYKEWIPDYESINNFFSGKKVLITGGGGFVGREICRQIITYNINSLIIVDNCEYFIYDIKSELVKKNYNCRHKIYAEIGSVCDKKRINSIFKEYRPDIVIHAASYNNSSLMEMYPKEVIKNNIFGTYNVVTASEIYEVEKFIYPSKDEFLNSSNILHICCRFCELLITGRKSNSTVFCCVRFGNTLSDKGYFIGDLFNEQIENGGPVTITHRGVMRYFITVSTACQLILETATLAESSKIYVLDEGEPISLLAIAEHTIRLAGLTPYKDIEIVETGLRKGDVLYAERINQSDLSKTKNDKIFVLEDFIEIEPEIIENVLNQLNDIIENDGENEVLIDIIEKFFLRNNN